MALDLNTYRAPVLGLVLLFGGCASEGRSIGEITEELTVCADGPTLKGIDVSHHQGVINWDAVRGEGLSFAFVRVSDGINTPDKQFDRNWAETKRIGIRRGVYQFFRPGQDPVAQANLLLERMGPLEPGDLPPVIDVEATSGLGPSAIVEAIRKWIERVESATGMKPIIYSGLYFWQDNVGNSTAFKDYPYWIPQYSRKCPNLPSAWSDWTFFQISETGKVSGIGGSNVDIDLFNGDMNDLEALAKGMAECGDGVCNAGETSATCGTDCPRCEPVADAPRIIDDDDPCVDLGGDLKYWRKAEVGHGGSLRWTYTTDREEAANYCAWNLDFLQTGRYKVEAHTPQPYSRSRMANYEIGHGGEITERVLNQELVDGWISLGEFEFQKGGNQYVFLGDNTGEHGDLKVQLVCDALRLSPMELVRDEDPMTPPHGTETAGERASIEGHIQGGCQTGPLDTPTTGWIALVAAIACLRRRDRRRANRTQQTNPDVN
ncbi:MAG: hypothetical protein KC416_01785 [Myxococcales bacterium]|nr:hypothetical protein [Myxococcales bacterium]